MGTKTAFAQRSELPAELSLALGKAAWSGAGQLPDLGVSSKPPVLSSMATPWRGRDSLGLMVCPLASRLSVKLPRRSCLTPAPHRGSRKWRCCWVSEPLLLLSQLSVAFFNDAAVMVKWGLPKTFRRYELEPSLVSGDTSQDSCCPLLPKPHTVRRQEDTLPHFKPSGYHLLPDGDRPFPLPTANTE